MSDLSELRQCIQAYKVNVLTLDIKGGIFYLKLEWAMGQGHPLNNADLTTELEAKGWKIHKSDFTTSYVFDGCYTHVSFYSRELEGQKAQLEKHISDLEAALVKARAELTALKATLTEVQL